MCAPDECRRRTETSHLLTKSLELRCHAHIFCTICVIIFQHTGCICIGCYAFYVYIYIYMHMYAIYVYNIYIW